MASDDHVGDLAKEYRSNAIAWDSLRNEPRKANRLFDRLHAIYKELRNHEAGRRAISEVRDDESLGAEVRLLAAADSLGWEADRSIAVLETIERDGPGLSRVTAKYTLKAYREGTLDLDW